MAKTRTLPDKYYDKDYETNGIHRVPLWRIAGFALNNTATNLYLMFMNYVSFYLLGFVGVGMVIILVRQGSCLSHFFSPYLGCI